jgi:hypothetical protein
MSAVVSTFVPVLSAFAAVVGVVLYLYFGRRSELDAAREEALALAETRRQVIQDLRGNLAALKQRHKRMKAEDDLRIRQLQAALDRTRAQARDEAYRTQHFYAATFADLLNDLRGDLECRPPDVDAALARIRKLLAGQRPAALETRPTRARAQTQRRRRR